MPLQLIHTHKLSNRDSVVCMKLRLPLLHPKSGTQLKVIAGVNDSLLACPSPSGGVLQWTGVRDSLDYALGSNDRFV